MGPWRTCWPSDKHRVVSERCVCVVDLWQDVSTGCTVCYGGKVASRAEAFGSPDLEPVSRSGFVAVLPVMPRCVLWCPVGKVIGFLARVGLRRDTLCVAPKRTNARLAYNVVERCLSATSCVLCALRSTG